jgi:hypothetical protein
MAKKHSRIKKHPDGFVQTDYVEPGSPEHAAFLGLEPSSKSDDTPFKAQDAQGRWWRLSDTTAFGPQVNETYLKEVLRQKLSSLDAEAPEVQSEDPFAPGYAPAMIPSYWLDQGIDGAFYDRRTGKPYRGG